MRSDSGERGIYKRQRYDGEYWAYRFQHDGKSYSETTDLKATQKLLPDARRARAEHLQRARLGRRQRTAVAVRFNDAVEQFVEWSSMEHREHPATAVRQATSLAIATRSFGDLGLDEITAGDIESFKMIRRKSEIAEVTIRKDLLALSQLFQFGIKHGWTARNPVKDVRLPSDRDSFNERTITPAEEALYFAQASQQNQVLHDVGRLMLWQGLRPGEILALTRDDVDIPGRLLFIKQGKSRAARRELYLVPNAAALLACRLVGSSEHLFPGWYRRRGRWEHSGKPYTYSGLVNAHKAAFEALNEAEVVVEPFDLYSLRHTFATRFYQATKDIDKLARILGHGSLATVRRYVNPTQDDLRAAMQAFEQAALAPPVDMPFPPNHMVTGQAPPKVHRTCPAGRGPLLQAAQKKPEALGVDPDTGQSVYLKAGRYGPYVQIGDASNGEKPETASLLPNMQPDQVNLEVALKLLPHALGQHPDDGAPVIAANGRFGPYVKWGKEVRSIPAGSSPLDITLEQALELLKHPGGQRPAPRLEKLKELGPHPISDLPIVILSGRYGPYVTDGKTNASLPRGTMPEKVSINDAISLLDARATRESHTQ